MLYEIHVTVDESQYLLLKRVAADEKLTSIMIRNEYGQNPFQLMITRWTDKESVEAAIVKAKEIAKMLQSKGLRVIRTKVETEIANFSDDFVPLGEEYFEFHMKVPFSDGNKYERLQEICKSHDAKISILIQSKALEFIPICTLRFDQCTKKEAVERRSKWIDSIREAGFPLSAKMHSELCVYDDNRALDQGWLN